jgi:hypothetical protein
MKVVGIYSPSNFKLVHPIIEINGLTPPPSRDLKKNLLDEAFIQCQVHPFEQSPRNYLDGFGIILSQ